MELDMNSAFGVYAVCCAVLVLKMFAVGHYTGLARFFKRSFLNLEDSQAFLQGEGLVHEEHPDVDRALRSHRNDLENILPFMILGAIYLQIDSSLQLARNLFITFTVARVLFSIAYFKAWQPWRSLLFLVAEVCNLIMVVLILIWAIKA